MFRILSDMRVVEAASFVAGPSCGLHLAQLGAEVIRLDQIGGSPDFDRWPLAPGGASLFWEGLNKGKKSVAIDLRHPEGRELAIALITAPGDSGGLFVTNFPQRGFLAHETLARHRPDLLSLRITGYPDGASAVDYTVNPAYGLPLMTGPEDVAEPVNHVLPAWDLLTGAQAATAMLAAERQRRLDGRGQEIRLALSDVATTTLGHLGQIAEASLGGTARPRYGNALFGGFGRDFVTADGARLMLVGLTRGQWRALVAALELHTDIARIEARIEADLSADDGLRFTCRADLFPLFDAAVARLDLATLGPRLDAAGACWSIYRSLPEAMRDDPHLSAANPVFSMLGHPNGTTYLTPGHAAGFSATPRHPPTPAPRPGKDTEQVLGSLLGLSSGAIARLHDRRIVASPSPCPA